MSRFIPVEPEKWGQMVLALSEVTRLKAEVERLKEGNECLDQMHEKEMARSAFLCEEVNRTTAWGRGLESDLSWARAELLMVKAEVERLTAIVGADAIDREHGMCCDASAQVERLTTLVESNLNQSKLAMAKSDASVRTLEAQVGRLIWAGDAMALSLQADEAINGIEGRIPPSVQAWLDARQATR